MDELFLIGTDHSHQIFGHKDGDSELFLEFLLAQIALHRISWIGEELNREALRRFRAAHSTAELAAKSAKIQHLFCDPDTEERSNLGIPTTEQLAQILGHDPCNLPHKEVMKAVDLESQKYWSARESNWLEKLQRETRGRAIFIFGSKHVDTFSTILRLHSVKYTIITNKFYP